MSKKSHINSHHLDWKKNGTRLKTAWSPHNKRKRKKTLTFLAQSFSYLAKKSGLFYIILEGPRKAFCFLAANKRQITSQPKKEQIKRNPMVSRKTKEANKQSHKVIFTITRLTFEVRIGLGLYDFFGLTEQ